MKKFKAFILTLILVLTSALCGCETANAQEITVTLNGEQLDFDVAPEIIDGYTMVPLRKIFEEIGALVKWDADTQTVNARKGAKTVSMTIGENSVTVTKNDTSETSYSDAAPALVSGRTLIPLRSAAESFGLDVSWDNETKTAELNTVSDDDGSWKENKVTVNLSSPDESLKTDGGIKITEGGDYTLEGTLNGSITVSADEKVKLSLKGAEISASGAPAIYIENADKAYITLEDGKNILTSDADKGTVFSKDNLEIKGSGTLEISNTCGNAIKSNDNLTVSNGKITIIAAENGISVNDTFKMTDGQLDIESVGDGISSDSIVNIQGGEINIKTTAEATVTESRNRFENGGEVSFETSSKGIKADWMMKISGGKINISSQDHAIHCADEIEIDGGKMTLNSEYGKGISGHGSVTVDGESTVIGIEKCTEGIESKNVLTVNDGKISVDASDDALNGGGTQGIQMGGMPDGQNRNGTETPPEMPEGDMGNPPEMPSDGNMQNPPEMPSDGNMQNPPEKPERGGFPGGGNMGNPPEMSPGGTGKADLKDVLIINGGDITLKAGDDCLDANGNLIINGGFIKASDPQGDINNVTGVFDADGEIKISENASIIAAARSGFQNKLSPETAVTVYLDAQKQAGDKISLSDAGGTVCEYENPSEYTVVYIVSPKLKAGEKYSVKCGSEEFEFEKANGSVTIGNEKSLQGRGNMIK